MKGVAVSLARSCGHLALAPLEALLAGGRAVAVPPPVFIIGPPRSGTTLLYEAMITRFGFAFISNAAHRFYRTPLAASYLAKDGIRNWRGDFTSSMGHIDGWAAPNEGGWVWRRWLPDGEWSDGTDLPAEAIAGAGELTRGLERILAAPFINKNVMHSNRLLAMHRIWPDARFIVVERDVADNVRSIVRALRGGNGPAVGGGEWRSVRPRIAPRWEHRSLVERSVAQVVGVGRDIMEDSKGIGPSRFLHVDYAELCRTPGAVFAQISGFLDRSGGAPALRGQLPERFGAGPSRLLPDDDERALAAARAELQAG